MTSVFSHIRRKYSELLAISISSYKDYLSLQRELIVAVAGAMITISLSLTVTLIPGLAYSAEASVIILTAGLLLSFHKILARASKALERARGLMEELPYLVFMASASARTGLELIEAMHFISSKESNVFRYFKTLSKRLVNASKYVGLEEALEGLAGIPRGVKKVLLTYLSSISLGTGIETLNTLSLEMIRDASKQAARSIDLAAQAGLLITTVLTSAPILILGISSILGSHIALSAGLAISTLTPVAILSLPQTPLPLRLVIDRSRRPYVATLNILSICLIASIYILIYLLALSMIRIDTAKNLIVILSLLMIVVGVPWLIIFTKHLADIKTTRDILISASSHAKAYRTLSYYDLDKQLRDASPYSPWILHYVAFSIEFLKEKGEIEPIVFTRFSEEIMDLIAKSTSRIMGSSLLLATALAQPVMLANMIPMLGSAAHSVGTITILLSSVAASSMIASKIFFNNAGNTLLTGLCFLLLYTLLLR